MAQTQGDLSPYYLVRFQMDAQTVVDLGDAASTPGMPAEVFIRTEERTLLNYLLKPFSHSLARTFNEN